MRRLRRRLQELLGLLLELRSVVAQPKYLVALWSGVVAYGVMGFIMTAAPISMHVIEGYALNEAKLVIQSHVVAMYLPSLFTGLLLWRCRFLGTRS